MRRGTALLSVLLLVAVMGAIAATALDRLGLATRLAANAGAAAQSRQWLQMAETIAMRRIENEVREAGPRLAQQLGQERAITLPDGQVVTATLSDGSNCFNVNSLVRERGGRLVADPEGVRQFVGLMQVVGIDEARARSIAGAATDYIDSDQAYQPYGAERLGDDAPSPAPNRAMASASELALVPGIDRDAIDRLEPHVCALPDTQLSALNIDTLTPEQAPLIAMLSPEELRLETVRAQLASRPADGYGSVYEFWNRGLLAGADVRTRAQGQLRVESRFFRLETAIDRGDYRVAQVTLIDWQDDRARRVATSWSGTL